MRPLYIEMTAFGSYGKKTKIDFTNISQNLFLISGETGSGKTTIFDAIVFALYGQASSVRNEKKGLLLQSQFVSIQDKPMVSFTFEKKTGDKSQTYTITRVPKHMRPKKVKNKGNDFVVENGYTELLLPDGSAYMERNVDEKIEEIVGLSREQFMQVAMIAQGEFMEILRAATDTKKEIFRKLFSTEIYEKITRILESRKKEKEIELAKIKTMCRSEVSRVIIPEVSEEFEDYEEFMELHGLLLNENITNLNDYLSILEKWCDRNDDVCISLKSELDNRKEKLKKINDEYVKAQALKAGFESLKIAQTRLKQYGEKKALIEEERRLLTILESAYEVKSFYDSYIENQERLNNAEKEIKRLKSAIPEAKEYEEKSRTENDIQKKIFETEKEKYIALKSKVDDAIKLFEKKKEKEKQYKDCCDRLQKKNDDLEKLEDNIKIEKNIKEKLEITLKNLSDSGLKLEKCNGDINHFLEAIKKCENIREIEQQIKTAGEYISNLKEKLANAKKTFEKHDENFRTLNEIYIEGQLGILAKEIEEGKPCPLCGSLEHPDVYSGSKDVDVSREDIKLAEQKRNDSNEMLRDISDRLTKYSAKHELFIVQRKEYIENLRDYVSFEGEDYAAAVDLRKHVLEEQKNLYLKETSEFEAAKKQRDESDKNIEKLKEQYEDVLKQTSSLKEEISASLSVLKELKNSTDFENEEDARLRENTGKERMKEAGTIYENTDKTFEKAKKQVADLEVLLKNNMDAYPEIKRICGLKEKTYNDEMKKHSFVNENDWLDYTKEYEKYQIVSIRDKISEYERIITEANAMKKAALDIIKDNEEPDLINLQEQKRQEEALVNEADEKYMRVYNRKHTNHQVLRTLSGHYEKQEKTLKEYGRIISLYRRISGNVSGKNKIDLETYVQRYYLKRIMHNANKRFEIMTSGQFRLMLKDIDETGKGRNEGLDLMVYSLVTGKKREIRTLSGGESFMAALSIALGMADQIKADNSVVNIDMMFIDEGFGSLDEHSRNQAVRILKEMAGGDRLIGIISHVTELKQQIGERLLVTKNENGSSVKWIKE